jgi:DENN (AEX-3) domain
LIYFTQTLPSSIPFELLLDTFLLALTEHSLLFLSQDPQLLSSFMFTLRFLINNSNTALWCHPFIPSLPNQLREVLEAPVTYMIGLRKSQDTGCSNLTAVRVDLDECEITTNGEEEIGVLLFKDRR